MENNRPKKWNWLVALLVLGAIVLFAVYLTGGFSSKKEVLTYDELIKKVDNQEIAGLYFTGNYKVNVLYNKDLTDEKKAKFLTGKEYDATSIIIFRDRLIETIQTRADKANEVTANSYKMPIIKLNDPEARSGWSTALSVISILLLVGIGVMLFMSMRGKSAGREAMSFAKTKARVNENTKIKFSDVAGAEEEKEELQEIVEFLKSPKKFKEVGARVPKGVLLVGKPGTGKTLFAKAVAGEANVPFFSISGSDFVEMFVGVGASRVRDLFNQAKKSQPCIVFIDEIDAVGRKRGAGLGGGNDEREQTLNQLLVQMDGFDENDGVVIIAATNRPDVLDPALLRPGRFDRQITVHMPDVKGREAIFRVHSRNKPLSPTIDFRNLARLTTGFSGADIENLLNEAAILAARANRKIIFMEDIYEGINKVIAGPQKKSRIVTERDRRITAYHEAGHALVGKLMKYGDTVQEVSIIPRGMAEGYTIFRSLTDDNHITYNYLMDTICKTLGGRAAEEIVIQDISTGASQDIKQATAIARRMVTDWGMSPELKNTYFGGEEEVFIGRDYQTTAMYSDEVAATIDRELRNIIDTNYDRALAVINENIGVLHSMVKLLYEHETIYGDEVDMLLEGKSVEEVSDYISKKKENRSKEAEEANAQAKATNPLGKPSDLIVAEEKATDEFSKDIDNSNIDITINIGEPEADKTKIVESTIIDSIIVSESENETEKDSVVIETGKEESKTEAKDMGTDANEGKEPKESAKSDLDVAGKEKQTKKETTASKAKANSKPKDTK